MREWRASWLGLLVGMVLVADARPASACGEECQEYGGCSCPPTLAPLHPEIPPPGTAPTLNSTSQPAVDRGKLAFRIADEGLDTSDKCILDDIETSASSVPSVPDLERSLFVTLSCEADGVQIQTLLAGQKGTLPSQNAPHPQGSAQTIGAHGQGSRGDGARTDPVDPITGEFIIRHVDLEYPGFGVPFRLIRTYRSRVDYLGPLGPAWDHGYNQRLFNAPSLPVDGSEPPPPPAYARLAVTTPPVPPLTAEGEGTSCGPTLLLSTGEGTTIRFRELASSGDTLSYWSQAAQLRLTGMVSASGTTWTLRSTAGDIRSFDEDGNLVGWVDANGVGLAFEWNGVGDDARLVRVIDSVGRVIDFEYDAANRLARVAGPDAAAGALEATYGYDADGALAIAHRGDGRGERYEYDFDGTRTRGDWIPEEQNRLACAKACARSDSTCDNGGACDEPVARATTECVQWVEGDAPGSCRPQCESRCRDVKELHPFE